MKDVLEYFYSQLKDSGYFDLDMVDYLGWFIYVLFMGMILI